MSRFRIHRVKRSPRRRTVMSHCRPPPGKHRDRARLFHGWRGRRRNGLVQMGWRSSAAGRTGMRLRQSLPTMTHSRAKGRASHAIGRATRRCAPRRSVIVRRLLWPPLARHLLRGGELLGRHFRGGPVAALGDPGPRLRVGALEPERGKGEPDARQASIRGQKSGSATPAVGRRALALGHASRDQCSVSPAGAWRAPTSTADTVSPIMVTVPRRRSSPVSLYSKP